MKLSWVLIPINISFFLNVICQALQLDVINESYIAYLSINSICRRRIYQIEISFQISYRRVIVATFEDSEK